MKRQLILSLLIIALSCKKDNSISIPIHQGSLSWFITTSHYFIDGAIDTMRITSADTLKQWASYFADVAPNSGFWDIETRYQVLTIDDTIEYVTILSSMLDSGNVRNDRLTLRLTVGRTEVSFTGMAYPANSIDMDSGVIYLPIWQANGRTFNDVYFKEVIGSEHVVAIVNAEYNLVGYFINGKLFSLRK